MRYILRLLALVFVFVIGILSGGLYFGGKENVIEKTKELIAKESSKDDNMWTIADTPNPVPAKSIAKPTFKPKPVVTPATPKKGQIYTVQVASFKDLTQARKYVDQLHDKKYDAYIAPSDISNNRGFYRVCIGESLSKDAALMNLSNLKKVFKDSFVQTF